MFMKKASEVHRPKGKIFLISDTHFDHENIIKYCDRPFNSKEGMNKAIIDNWNDIVGDSDTVYILGDVTFGRGHRPIDHWMTMLKGKKFLVKGNHDKGKVTKAAKIANGTILEYNGLQFMLMHEPRRMGWKGWIIHGGKHNHDLKNFPLVNCEKKMINVCVEPIDYRPVLLDEVIERIEKCE